MKHTSLQSKILLALSGLVLFSTLLIMFFVKGEVDKKISSLQNSSAKALVSTVALNVKSQYENLLYFKRSNLTQKKRELKEHLEIAKVIVQEQYQQHKRGEITEQEAKQQAMNTLRMISFLEDSGYFWINDTGDPVPRMVMHPTQPELEGKLLDDPLVTSLGTGENLFVVARDMVLAQGSGYLNYLWPKPGEAASTTKSQKLSYLILFKEWGWIIGSGIYLDDLKTEVNSRLQALLEDLSQSFSDVRVGQNGYMYLFNGDGDMLIHPTLAGRNFLHLVNPTNGNKIFNDLLEAAASKAGYLEYIWDKPPEHKGDFRFWKKSHIIYFKPLDWYIASTVYTDEIEAPAKGIARYILVLAMVILLFAFLLSIFLARSLIRPLKELTEAAQEIEYSRLGEAEVPVTGSEETRRLGLILNSMLDSFRDAVRAKDELFNTKLELENRLHKAEKMESVGRLAAGIAHEINTPAQFVSTNIEFIKDATLDIDELMTGIEKYVEQAKSRGCFEDTAIEDFENLLEAADWEFIKEELPMALAQSEEGVDRISKIVSAMKNFSHPSGGQMEAADINQGIRDTVTVTRNEWKYAAEMNLQLDTELPSIPCYLDELNQVILNMIINSAHAIAEKNKGADAEKGKITVHTGVVEGSGQIKISDTGIGMSEDVAKKVFDPFYTTKEVGEGSGQGLAIAHDIIVNKHCGTIEVESSPGMGTTFIITLPLEKNNKNT